MNKKLLISAAVAAMVVIGAGTSFWYSKPKLDPEVQKRIDLIVMDRELNPWGNRKDRIPDWKILAKMPKNPPLEQWDEVHEQPQVMFNYGKNNTIYTMNINGTDIRKLLDRDKLGELPASGYNMRSPDGRYLSIHYFYGLANFTCLIFDLKERKIVNKLSSCGRAKFSNDSQYYYYSDSSPIHRQPIRITLDTGKSDDLMPDDFVINGATYYPSTETQTFMVNKELNLLIWSGAKENPGGEIIDRVQAGFDLKTLKLKEVKNYLMPDCQDGFDYNPNREYFICGYSTRNENKIFSTSEPTIEIENALLRNVIKPNAWYFEPKGNQLLRYRQPNEVGIFDKIKYYYEIDVADDKDTYRLNFLNVFIPEYLASQFDTFDLKSFFPAIPTQEQYDESYQRQLKDRKEGKE